MARKMKLQLHQGMNGDWHSRIKAANGEITLVSEGYRKRHDGLRQFAANLCRLRDHLAGMTDEQIQAAIEVLPRE